MIRVAVMGSTGQLGTDLVDVLQQAGEYLVFPLSHVEVECIEPDSVRRVITSVHPEVVVNCAAFVRVDECEDRPDDAFSINALGALNVVRACSELNALCVYISTDYVFDGKKEEPYTEEDSPYPLNVYGASKLAGEYLVRQACSKWLIARMASLFGKAGARGKGGNFIESILAKAQAGEPLRIVNDIRMSPTYTYDASCVLERLIEQRTTGVFHITNSGSCTWYEFARKALELVRLSAKLEPISSADYPTKADRPKNSSLRSVRLAGKILRPWEEALWVYLGEKGHIHHEKI